MEIIIDKNMIDVLSSDTRRKILGHLNSRPLTVSDLSRLTGIQKSALHKHLQILMDAELICKKESNNEFVYYNLTDKGKMLMSQDSNLSNKIYIVLTASIISLIGGLIGILMFAVKLLNIPELTLGSAPGTPTIAPSPTIIATSLPSSPTSISPVPPVPSASYSIDSSDVILIIGIFLTVAGLFLLYYSLRSIRARKFHKFSIPFIRK